MFLGGFKTEPDPFEVLESAPPPVAPSKPAPRENGPGEFTQMFDPVSSKPAPMAPAAPSPAQSAGPGEVTRIFAPPAAAQKMRGFSSPGGSDSASAEGSFTQVFRAPSSPARPPAPPVEKREWPSAFESASSSHPQSPPPEPVGVTDLFQALSGAGRPDELAQQPAPVPGARPMAPAAGSESFTMLLQKLTENAPASRQNFETQQLAPAPVEGQGEFTRIITRGDAHAESVASPLPGAAAKAPALPAIPSGVAKPAVPAAPAAPKLAAPPVSPPKGKLQEMVPILLVLNAFLMVVVIVVVVFALMHRP